MFCCSHHLVDCVFLFFFKQKTAYEMRISDWSSDVCSSDLNDEQFTRSLAAMPTVNGFFLTHDPLRSQAVPKAGIAVSGSSAKVTMPKIGRASCRERVCQYV